MKRIVWKYSNMIYAHIIELMNYFPITIKKVHYKKDIKCVSNYFLVNSLRKELHCMTCGMNMFLYVEDTPNYYFFNLIFGSRTD